MAWGDGELFGDGQLAAALPNIATALSAVYGDDAPSSSTTYVYEQSDDEGIPAEWLIGGVVAVGVLVLVVVLARG